MYSRYITHLILIQPYELGNITISIVQMSKVMHREVKYPMQGHTADRV